MKKTNKLFIFIILVSVGFIFSCRKNKPISYARPTLPKELYSYALSIPISTGSSSKDNLNEDNKITYTDEVITLGRVLFYDKQLSANANTACGSCHQQKFAFAENKKTSTGFNHVKGTRNAISLANARFNWDFFWDVRDFSLEHIMLQPVTNHIEMGFIQAELLPDRLKKIDYYPDLFKQAYGNAEITNAKISTALSHFLRSLVSKTSKFDYNTNVNKIFNESENRGSSIFFSSSAKCSGCHFSNPLGKGNIENIGLDVFSNDVGIGFRDSNRIGAFSVPTIRNIALTAPYMHDGRFNTLEEVLDHYCCNIQPAKHLSPILKNQDKTPVRIHLTSTDKIDLINFLNTFTDEEFIRDKRFSNPFN